MRESHSRPLTVHDQQSVVVTTITHDQHSRPCTVLCTHCVCAYLYCTDTTREQSRPPVMPTLFRRLMRESIPLTSAVHDQHSVVVTTATHDHSHDQHSRPHSRPSTLYMYCMHYSSRWVKGQGPIYSQQSADILVGSRDSAHDRADDAEKECERCDTHDHHLRPVVVTTVTHDHHSRPPLTTSTHDRRCHCRLRREVDKLKGQLNVETSDCATQTEMGQIAEMGTQTTQGTQSIKIMQ